MINQLFRTRFESNMAPFIVFLAMNALLGLRLVVRDDDSGWRPESVQSFAEITVWLFICCLVAAAMLLLRHNRERNGRLYAQLPVTSLEIRLSYWCHAGLYLCISSLVLLLAMIFAGAQSVLAMLQFTLLYFVHAGALLAVISIVTSNTLRLIPDEIRKRTVVYFFLATFITFLFMFAIGVVIASYDYVLEGNVQNWSLVTLLTTLVCSALVALDVHLFRRKDNYLN
ncbi:MAG: hypothetical protein V4603_18790 [Pseudomonadota bacterium]